MCEMNNLLIIIVLIVIIIILIINRRTREKFTTTDDINQAVNDLYKADVNAIRNLSNFATEIKNNNDTLTIPAKTTTMTDLTVNGNINIVQFKGLIVIWSGTESNIPKGWALCDGRKYKLDSTNTAMADSTGTITPDLRGRFILSSGQGDKLTNRTVAETGGSEKVTLTVEQIPSHSHSVEDAYFAEHSPPYNMGGSGDTDWDNGLWKRYINTGNTGGSQSHENMPPYYVLTYIMKL